MSKHIRPKRSAGKNEGGFSLLEVLISMLVMTTGLLGLLGSLGLAMAATQNSEQLSIAKQLANEALESILTARTTAQVQWQQIANGTCSVGQNCGIFLSNPQPINNPGVDGIIGTSDDAAAGPEILESPGPNGIILTPAGQPCAAPDVCTSLTNFTRTIAISQYTGSGTPDPNLDTVVITVTYNNLQFGSPESYVLQTLVSQYR